MACLQLPSIPAMQLQCIHFNILPRSLKHRYTVYTLFRMAAWHMHRKKVYCPWVLLDTLSIFSSLNSIHPSFFSREVFACFFARSSSNACNINELFHPSFGATLPWNLRKEVLAKVGSSFISSWQPAQKNWLPNTE